MHVEDVLSAPAIGVRIILVGAQPPIGRVGHRVGLYGAQEPHLLVRDVDPIHQRLEVGRIPLAVRLDLNSSLVGCIFVAVDGVAHLPQVAAEFALLCALHLEFRNRQRRAGQDADNRHRDNQFDQCQSRVGPQVQATRRRARGFPVGNREPRTPNRGPQCPPHFTWTTACPPPASRPPVSTFTSCSTLGSNWSCSGTENTSCAFDRYTDAVKVLPTVCVELGGSTVRATGCPVAASVFAAAGDPGIPPGTGGIACCFICWTTAEAALPALVAGAAAGAALSGVLSSSCPADRRTSMSLKVPVSIERVFRRVSVDSRRMCGTRTN